MPFVKSKLWNLFFREREKTDHVFIIIFSLLFGWFLVVGNEIQTTGTFWTLFEAPMEACFTLFLWIYYSALVWFPVSAAWSFLDDYLEIKGRLVKQPKNKYLDRFCMALNSHPFRTTFLFFMILFTPYFVAYYPGIFMGDTKDLILQAYNLPEYTSNYLNLLDESIRLNQHHPVAHTMFLHLCIELGHRLAGSWNMGVFFYSMAQAMILFAAVGYAMTVLTQAKVPAKLRFGLLCYLALHPKIRNYVFLVSKDTMYASFFLFFILSFYGILKDGTKNRKTAVVFLISTALMVLFRNDAKIFIAAALLVAAWKRKKIRKFCLLSGIVVLTGASLYGSALTSMGITPGSRREMLSVPFQQTARYMKEHGDEITKEEYDAINAVLDAETIASEYDPDRADNVKATFREDATREEIAAYFKTWWNMFLKHPETYIDATVCNIYGYFAPSGHLTAQYPSASSKEYMKNTNLLGESLGMDFHHPESLNAYRILLFDGYALYCDIPALRVVLMSFTYVWMLLLWAGYCVRQKKVQEFIALLPMLFSICIFLAGPCNGWYFRYLLPLAVALPFLIVLERQRW